MNKGLGGIIGLVLLFAGISVQKYIGKSEGLFLAIGLYLVAAILLFIAYSAYHKEKKLAREKELAIIAEALCAINTAVNNTGAKITELQQKEIEYIEETDNKWMSLTISNQTEMQKKAESILVELENQRNSLTENINQGTILVEQIVRKSQEFDNKWMPLIINNQTEMQKKTDSVLVELKNHHQSLAENISRNNALAEQLVEKAEEIVAIPNIISEAMEDMREQIETAIESTKNLFEDLSDEMEKINKNTNDSLNDSINDYIDEMRDHEQAIVSAMENMLGEYKMFEKTTDSLIQQMTLMAEKDIDVMRRFMDEY